MTYVDWNQREELRRSRETEDKFLEAFFVACKKTNRFLLHGDRESAVPTGRRDGQYGFDETSEEIFLRNFNNLSIPVLSEEGEENIIDSSGYWICLDPVDGSTNYGNLLLPFCSTASLLFGDDLIAGAIFDHISGDSFWALSNLGAYRNGMRLRRSNEVVNWTRIAAVNGFLKIEKGVDQIRSFGCCSYELAKVAEGSLCAFFDVSKDGLYLWDYSAGILLCKEVGLEVSDLLNRNLVDRIHPRAPRSPVVLQDESDIFEESLEIAKEVAIRHSRAKYLTFFNEIFSVGNHAHPTSSSVLFLDTNYEEIVIVFNDHLEIYTHPGGHGEEGEAPHETALREAKEEVSAHVELICQEPVNGTRLKVSGSHFHDDLCFVATLRGNKSIVDDSRMKIVHINQAKNYLDSYGINCISRALEHIKEHK